MTEYHKIQTVFLRDPATNYRTLLAGQYARPEFGYLAGNRWQFTEKVDGTNIRVLWDAAAETLSFRGKTDRAQIPPFLLDRLHDMFSLALFSAVFSDTDVALYGEGYGARIQKGGGRYKPDGVDFVLFDVRVGDWWLKREDVEDVAQKLGIQPVPVLGYGTLPEMVEMVSAGFGSRWGDFCAEGIVARPVCELADRDGQRIITKLKCRDFGVGGV